MSEEQELNDDKWPQMIVDLQEAGYTLERIANEVGVGLRQVSNWKNGDRPIGLKAIRLYLLHVKRPPAVLPDPSATSYARLSPEQKRRANARAYANCYLRRGRLSKQPCEDCGAEGAEMHHDDYDKPLQVRWKCRACHMQHHEKVDTNRSS